MIAHVPRPMCWGYARVSDEKQDKKGNSIPEQCSRIENYYRFKLAPDGVDWAGIVSDPKAVSASKKAFSLRQAGGELMEKLRAGDHMIVDKIDRLARNAFDLHSILDWMEKHEVTLHICDLLGASVDMKSPMGRFTIGLLGLLAEFESRQLSERHIAHYREARKMGRAVSHYPTMGTKHYKKRIGRKTYTMVAWDPDMRGVMQEIVRLHDVEGLSFGKIAKQMEMHFAQANGRVYVESAFLKKEWPASRCFKAYVLEKWFTAMGFKEVTELPSRVSLAAHAWGVEQGLCHPTYQL